ncbi:MAG: FmdB family zinc ribbon protein [Acidimicrobiales bacterium]|jgi:putative FmdB family regulatory protein
MPTYEYSCKSCGEHLEVVQSFKDDALTECPNCGGALKKVFGNIGIVFKGSGFYKNDSRDGRSGVKTAAAAQGGSGEVTSTPSSTEPSKAAAGDTAAPSKPAAVTPPASSPSTPASGARSSKAEAAS